MQLTEPTPNPSLKPTVHAFGAHSPYMLRMFARLSSNVSARLSNFRGLMRLVDLFERHLLFESREACLFSSASWLLSALLSARSRFETN